jgi:hypothetical protein
VNTVRILALAAATALSILASGAAHAACYEEQPGTPILSCSGGGGNSADFAQTCTFVAGPPVQVEVQCPGRWVNIVYSTDTHAQACARAGLSPANIAGQVCASGERRPSSGENWAGISYRYGTWGIDGVGGNSVEMKSPGMVGENPHSPTGYCGGTDNPCQPAAAESWCWFSGQKRDYDGTDRTVAYYCE